MNFKQTKLTAKEISDTIRKQYRSIIEAPDFIADQNRIVISIDTQTRVYSPVNRLLPKNIRIRYNRADWELTYNMLTVNELTIDEAYTKIINFAFNNATSTKIKKATVDKLLIVPAYARNNTCWGIFQKV